MAHYHHFREQSRRRARMTGFQRVLPILIALSMVGIIIFLFMTAQAQHVASVEPENQPAPSPVVYYTSPIPNPSPTASPSPTPTASPSPTPTPQMGALGYPLYKGNSHLPEIALTFDDGPNPYYTSQVLALLRRYGVKATFFLIGSLVAAYPNLVQQEYQQGDVVGNHTWTHPELIKLSSPAVRYQLQSTSNELQAVTGVSSTIFRPPYGEFNRSIQSTAASLGLSTILWNVDPKDWSLPGTNVIISRVLHFAHNGSIILMHDGGGNRLQTVAALPTIITLLKQQGFQFVTIPRLIQDLGLVKSGAAPTPPPQLSSCLFLLPVVLWLPTHVGAFRHRDGRRADCRTASRR